ncbi:MAG: hypothetical protein ACTSXY_16420 [Promethearchaeota archaeon]
MTKPVVKLFKTDGNLFVIIGKVGQALKEAGMEDKINIYMYEALNGDFKHALRITEEYVIIEKFEEY